jgi:hypothetical protein
MTAAAACAAARARLHRPTPVPAETRAPESSSESAASSPRDAGVPGPPDDSWRLMVLLGVFVVSPLIVVGALWAVTAINTSWALIGALGVYATTTLVVFGTVAFVLSDHLRLPGRRRMTGEPALPALQAERRGHEPPAGGPADRR